MTGPPRLVERSLERVCHALPEGLAGLIAAGLARGERIDCFDFVPCDYHTLYAALAALPRGRYCEWGSGMGIGVALAETLGFEACGIELDPELAQASRKLLADYDLRSPITTGSYFEVHREADVYFAYTWPGKMMRLEEHFVRSTTATATLLICDGAARPLFKVKELTK